MSSARRVLVLLLLLLVGALSAPATAAPRLVFWSTFEAEQHLKVGRFAARYDVRYANCVGSGPSRQRYGTDIFRTFDCSVQNADFENERQLVLRVTSAGSFAVTWLTEQTCSPKARHA